MRKIVYIFTPIFFIISILFYTLFSQNLWSSQPSEPSSKTNSHYQLSQFISPETCGGCHSEIYSQWQGSMHNLAHKDIIYNEVARASLVGLTNKDEIAEAEHCQTCHTPIGYITGYPLKTSDDIAKVADIAKEGISCDYCHSITGAYAVYNAQFKYAPGNGEDDPGVKRGPRKDAEPDFHLAEFSDFHTKSELCGTCHDVKHITFGTWLETTYQEWKSSPYSKQGVQCQDCHMYQRLGNPATGSTERAKNSGSAADGAKERDHIFTHYFVGANMAIPTKEGNKALVQMAEERLKNTVDIKIEPKSEGNSIVVRIKNIGAGHEVPTGLSNIRQVWLKLIAKDSKGKIIYTTGLPDDNGNLPNNTVIYTTIFGDGKGNPVDNLAKAKEIISNKRLKPMQEQIEKIDIGKFEGKITVEASILYRGVPQNLANSLKALKDMDIPVVVMKDVKSSVER
ncbi:MAG: cytochrome c554 family protein [Desulfamplus sp.]|nr:cytochrome c554 family protein [Desulfamplus sp.]